MGLQNKYILIGHRGTGKTSLLHKMKTMSLFKEFNLLDLDEAIEKKHNQSIADIFSSDGESVFRTMECETLTDITNNYLNDSCVICLGAGFQGDIPKDYKVIWVRRDTDKLGRVFLDRPRLDLKKSSFDEYMYRFALREQNYQESCHVIMTLPEGQVLEPFIEFYFSKPQQSSGSLTENQKNLNSKPLVTLLPGDEPRLELFYELREDLLSVHQLEEVIKKHYEKIKIISLRNNISSALVNNFLDLKNQGLVDVSYELMSEKGKSLSQLLKYIPEKNLVISLHNRSLLIGTSLYESLNTFSQQFGKQLHLKIAILIESLEELFEVHKWWAEDPENRSFLPSSEQGRWSWYRLLYGPKMKIHFVREGTGTAPDQPYLFEWLESAHFDNIKFAAILGNPVTQSMTPSEQGPFFNQYNMPVLKLMLSEKDLTAKSLEILYDLGLRAAAVTSPLKQVMFNLSTKLSKNAAELEAVNTVLLEKNKELIIYGENTDLFGLEELISYANAQFEFQKPGFEVVLWGGGGVRSSVKKLLPQLKTYSARNAKPLTCQDKVTEPKVIIWAVGRSRQEACKWPLEKFKPSLIIDLNYTMDSPGREYALRVGAKYVSGLKMFEKQADLQRQFWKGKL